MNAPAFRAESGIPGSGILGSEPDGNAGIYRYDDVPAELWSELRQSASKGKFFQERIRDQFPTARV